MSDERTAVIEAMHRTEKGASPFEVLGSTGLVRSGGYVDEEWLQPLRGQRGVRVYREMRDNDASIGASFHLIDSLVRQVKWTPQPPAEQTPGQLECVDFVEQCMGDMSSTFADFISETLSMQWFGWSIVEKVYKRRGGKSADPTRNSKYTDGRLGWRKLSLRAQETLDRWDFDDDGGVRGFWQSAAPSFLKVYIPIEKLILFRTEMTKGNPEGRSLLRNAYRSWYFLKRMQEIEAVGIERDLVGLPKLELPMSYFQSNADPAVKQQAQHFQRMLQQIRRNEHEGVCLPSELGTDGKPTGFKLSLLSTGGSRSIDPSAAVQRYETRVAQTLFTQFMFLGMNGVGTQALGRTLTDVFVTGLSVLLDIVEETLHRFGTTELLELNGYKDEDRCRITHGEIVSKDMAPLAKTILDLVSAGAITPDMTLEEYLRDELRLPEREEGDDDPVQPEARASAAARLAAARSGKGDNGGNGDLTADNGGKA